MVHSQCSRTAGSPWEIIGTNCELYNGEWKWLGHAGVRFHPSRRAPLDDILENPKQKWFNRPGTNAKVAKVAQFMRLMGLGTGHVGVRAEQWKLDGN